GCCAERLITATIPTCTRHDSLRIDPGAALVGGLGCRRGGSAAALSELIEDSLRAIGLNFASVPAMASIDM
ncbi:cobalamin biosynthesis protein, partial [Pseudomonas syringae group genomosp. 7]|uniref:cobalamin biosynthesis protein n=1 Tax=Pseudomonas syringae group genomosp. 7 TaxID=251699 RepID=UPI00376F5D5C